MAIILNDNIQANIGKPVENKYLEPTLNRPYTGVTEANSTILEALRFTGLTVNINGEEYWYASGTGDGDLVAKSSSGGATNVTGATNGLSVNGSKQAVLGGTLTSNTTINGDGKTLTFGTYGSSPLTSFNTNTTGNSTMNFAYGSLTITDGAYDTFVYFDNAYGGQGIEMSAGEGKMYINNNGVCINSTANQEASLTSTGTGGTVSLLVRNDLCGLRITDGRTGSPQTGIEYNADYSANYTPRSLVDKGYVTGLTTTSGVQSASNGLTKVGDTVILGGTLTGNTTVDTNNNGFAFGLSASATGSDSIAMGYNSSATGACSNAFGSYAKANGIGSTAVGYQSYANGNYSFAGGYGARAYATCSIAFGINVQAYGDSSFASGILSKTYAQKSAIFGGCNNIIASGNTNATIIGGNTINLTGTSYIDTTAVGNLAIFSTPATDTDGAVLVWDSVSKKVGKTTLASITGSSLQTASNGLTATGQDVALGGTLGSSTTIAGAGNAFTINNTSDVTLGDNANMELSVTGSSAVLDINAKTNSQLVLKSQSGTNAGDTFTDSIGINMDYNGDAFTIVDNRGTAKGIEYLTDYSLNYTNRSLVDKAYVDAVATGLDVKDSSNVATTANIDLTGGTFSGGSTIDGIVVQDGWRVLVKNQTLPAENGIYDYDQASSGFTRSSDFDGNPTGEVTQGSFTFVITGDTQANTAWIVTTPDPITVGTTAINFTVFSQPFDIVDGTGTTINIVGSNKSVSIELAPSSGLDFDSASAAGRLRLAASVAGSGIDLTSGVLSVNANNGLSVVGNQVVLGGTLTGDTQVDTANAHGVSFGNCTISSGNNSFATGYHSCATGNNSFAAGCYACATGCDSIAMGGTAISSACSSVALGYQTCATGYYSTALGYQTRATGYYSFASGMLSKTYAWKSAIFGGCNNIIASGNTNATIIGGNAINLTGTSYIDHTAVGNLAIFSTPATDTDGEVLVWDSVSKKVGKTTLASITGSSLANASNGLTKVGDTVILGGTLTGNTCITTSGNYGIAFNGATICNTSIDAFGVNLASAYGCRSFGANTSSADGYNSTAINGGSSAGDYSFAQGFGTALGCASVALGYNAFACGNYSFAGGNYSCAIGDESIAFGNLNKACASNSTILGGTGNTIAVGNINATIIGGNAINLTGTSYIDHTAVGNLAIFSTPATDTDGEVLVWDSVSKKVGKTTLASITGSSLANASNGLTKVGDTVILGGTLTGNTIVNTNNNSLSFGSGTVTGTNNFSTGVAYISNSTDAIALGYGGIDASTYGISVQGYLFNSNCSIAIGKASTVRGGSYNIAVGAYAIVNRSGINTSGGGKYNTSIGSFSNIWEDACGATVVGSFSKIGSNTNPNANFSTTIGYSALALRDRATSIGAYSNAEGSGTTSIGFSTNVNQLATYSVAIGYNHGINGVTGATLIGGSNRTLSDTALHNYVVTSNLAIETSPDTGSASDPVLVWNSTDKKVKQISASSLGEDNNVYSTTGFTASTGLTGVTLTGTEYVVLVDTSSAVFTVTLPSSPVTGQAYKIKDKGNALTNSITISGNGNNIDGSSTASINTDYGALELVFDGTDWFSLAFIN